MKQQSNQYPIISILSLITIIPFSALAFTSHLVPRASFYTTSYLPSIQGIPSHHHNNIRTRYTSKQISIQKQLNMSTKTQETESKPLLLSKIKHLSKEGPIRLILASASPRRQEILTMMGLDGKFTVQPSPLDESQLQQELPTQDLTPVEYNEFLAKEKASALAKVLAKEYESASGESSSCNTTPGQANEDSTTDTTIFIIGSDTIVDLNGIILEKPKSTSNAIEMLTQLSGSWHKVHTGVAIYKLTLTPSSPSSPNNESCIECVSCFVDTAQVKFAPISSSDIQEYVNTEEPMDKAGSYGIQGIGGQLVERMEGDFFSVMGLPMHRLSLELAAALDEV